MNETSSKETINAATPDLALPARFLTYAQRDIARAIPASRQLFRARFKALRQQSWLGWLWLFLPTFGIALASVFIQRRAIVTIGTTDIPYPAFVLTGLVAWQTFTDAIYTPWRRLEESRPLLTHSDVPHETVLISAALEVALGAVTRLCVVIPVVSLLWVAPGWGLLLTPLTLIALLAFGFAIGMILTPIALLYSDVGQGLPIALLLLMFLTPVFYPIPAQGLLALNPLGPLINGFRGSLTDGAIPGGFMPILIVSLCLLTASWLLYRLARPFVIERLG